MDMELKLFLREILMDLKLMIIMEAAKQLNGMGGMEEDKYKKVLADTIKTKQEEISDMTFGPLKEDDVDE